MMTRKFSKQRGVSLVELMVGLVLSLIVILGMVATYTMLGRSTLEAKLGALNDSKVTTALLTADRILQGVGFGLINPSIKLYEDNTQISISEAGSKGNILVWETESSGTCNALIGGRKLEFINGFPCSSGNVSELSDISIVGENAVNLPNAPDVGEFEFVVTKLGDGVICTPYGIAGAGDGGKYVVDITAGIYAGSELDKQNVLKGTTCLFNLK